MNSTANPHGVYASQSQSYAGQSQSYAGQSQSYAGQSQSSYAGHEYRQPVMPIKADDCCPSCQANLAANPNILSRLRSAFFQLLSALFVIVLSILRLARLIVAGVFTLFGLIGTGLYIAGQHIIHPDDRRLLPSLPRSNIDDSQAQ